LQGCQFDFGINNSQADGLAEMGMKINNEKTIVDPSVVLQLGDIQRNRIVRCHTILSMEQFYNIKCTIFVEYDPKTKSPIFIDFTR